MFCFSVFVIDPQRTHIAAAAVLLHYGRMSFTVGKKNHSSLTITQLMFSVSLHRPPLPICAENLLCN